MTRWLRYAGLASLGEFAWALSGAAPTGAAVAWMMFLVIGFTLASWEPSSARWAYLGVAAVCASAIVIGGLITGHRDGAQLEEGLITGLGVFLAIAVPTFVIGRLLPLVCEIKQVGRLESQYGRGDEGVIVWTIAMSAAYSLPIGVAAGLIIGLSVGGSVGFVLAVLVGALAGAVAAQVGFGAGMWRVGELTGPVELINREQFLKQAKQVPADILSIVVAAIATVVLGLSDAAEFALTQGVELFVTTAVTGVLAGLVPVLVIRSIYAFPSFNGFFRTLKVIVVGVGAGLGIMLGVLAAATVIENVQLPDRGGLAWLGGIAAIAAIVALALGRLGTIVGFVIGATLGVVGDPSLLAELTGGRLTGSPPVILGLAGMIGGTIVYGIIDAFFGIVGSEAGPKGLMRTSAVLLFGGAFAGVAFGVASGIGAM